MVNKVFIGQRAIGEGHPAYIVAEIGINHGGDMTLAKKMIDAAKSSGVDAVKFQNYKTEDFVPTRKETHSYISNGKAITETQYDLFKRYELSNAQIVELAQYCQNKCIDFHSTPTNKEGVLLLKRVGVKVLKNGSDYLSNIPLIEDMAAAGLPTVLSTGMATIEEIKEAINSYKNAKGKNLILLHCVSQYPTPLDELKLKRITFLQNSFKIPVGFSDHSSGVEAAPIAIALGACWIEKHFTLDRSLPGPDHTFSCTPTEMQNLVRVVRAAETALSFNSNRPISRNEEKSRALYRLSCAASRNLKAGTVLTLSDIAFFRPGNGFPPKDVSSLIGRTLSTPIQRGSIFLEDCFI